MIFRTKNMHRDALIRRLVGISFYFCTNYNLLCPNFYSIFVQLLNIMLNAYSSSVAK
ncbi:hypothetical protein HanPSC8_Chr16g0716191 [Helianthus annuus]|nr:hypothetical protein HanPSC8_Chr16g0716191 [Helianthus annuus]